MAAWFVVGLGVWLAVSALAAPVVGHLIGGAARLADEVDRPGAPPRRSRPPSRPDRSAAA